MPVFTALMTGAFGSEDPFDSLVRNDGPDEGEGDVRNLPLWVEDRIAADLESRQIVQ